MSNFEITSAVLLRHVLSMGKLTIKKTLIGPSIACFALICFDSPKRTDTRLLVTHFILINET